MYTNNNLNIHDTVTSINKEVPRTSLEIGDTSLLNNSSIQPTYSNVGTTLAIQNSFQTLTPIAKKDEFDLLEIDWDYKKTTSKPFVQNTFTWLSTQTSNQTIQTYNFPIDYFNSNHVLSNVGDNFLSFRGDLHFVVSLQSNPLNAGALIVSPQYGSATSSNLTTAFFRDHIILDASDNSTTVDLFVPFKCERNGVDPFDTTSVITIRVLTPLSGATSINGTITCFLENQEFKFLRPKQAVTRMTQGLLNFTTINNTLSDIQNATLPTNMTGDSLDITGKMMDDVGISTNPSAVIIKFNSLNNSDNPHYIEKMSLTPSAVRVSNDATFNTNVDEMSIQYLAKKEHYLRSFNISTTTTAGSQIINIPVCPNPDNVVSPNSYNDVSVNNLHYISSLAKFWRGGLKYKVRFHMNRFQSLKVYVGLFYKSITPTVFTDWSSSHGAIVDIGGDQREIVIEVPYNSETPWLHVPNRFLDITAPSDQFRKFNVYDYILGQLAIYSLTPLMSPTGSPTSITAHISMVVADDFELANLSTSTRVMHSDILLSERSKRTPNFMTDNITSIKQVFQKWHLLQVGEASLEKINNIVMFRPSNFLHANLPPAILSSGDTFLTEPSSKSLGLQTMYEAYNGGIKIRIKLNLNRGSRSAPDQPILPGSVVPFCYYVNDDGYDMKTSTAYANQAHADAVQNFERYTTFDLNPSNTPYVAQEINVSNPDGSIIYEIEIPFQRNLKYTEIEQSVPDYFKYGYIICGYKVLTDLLEPNARPYFSFEIMGKMADDARLGIAQHCLATFRSTSNWLTRN